MRRVTTEIKTDQFWLLAYNTGEISLMPPPKDIMMLSGMQTCGEITHAMKMAVLDEWRKRAVQVLLKLGILEIKK